MALFPPIVASSMPAFAINPNSNNNSVTIYYTLSNYNQSEYIKNVQVSVRLQSSNNNIINNNSEILIKPFTQTEQDKIFNRYSLTINENELSENFVEDTLYKIQLRFSSIQAENITARFFSDNIQHFSEWSTVCLIKPIIPPIFYIDDFHYDKEDDYGQEDNAEDTFFSPFADFIGVYKTVIDTDTQTESSEVLKSWRLRLYDQNNNLLKDSGQNLISAYNYNINNSTISFKCSLPYAFQNKRQYFIVFDIKTKNDYIDSKTYYFTTSLLDSSDDGTFQINRETEYYAINEEEGYIKLKFEFQSKQEYNIVIRRSDAAGNFLNWVDLKIFQGVGKDSFIYYDFTAESGVVYKYIVQMIDEKGRYTSYAVLSSHVFITEWEHAFLLEKADDQIRSRNTEQEILFTPNENIQSPSVKQLKLKYDFQISSYKTNITENLTTTIGSKYPFIRRNGDNYYKSFPITGTISQYMDNVDFFISKKELLDNAENDYNNYFKGQTGETESVYNYIYERKFREEVEKFLYNNKPKLYKSTQQGNILIKLMQVSLTPKNELGRLIYTFSATAYEIGEANIENLINYNIISQGYVDPTPQWTGIQLGQLNSFESDDRPQGKIFKANEDIIGGKGVNGSTDFPASQNSIALKYNYKKSINKQILDDFYLKYLRITMQSEPYLIIEEKYKENGKQKSQYRPYDDTPSDGTTDLINFGPDIINPLYRLESSYKRKRNNITDNIYLGYLFEINGQPIIISSNGIYELKDKNLKISSQSTIVPKKDCVMTIDYTIYKKYITDLNVSPTRVIQQTKIGQVLGSYTSQTELINLIKNKYNTTLYTVNKETDRNEQVVQRVKGISSVQIEAEPRTQFILQSSTMDTDQSVFTMNETGLLNIDFKSFNEMQNNLNAPIYISQLRLADSQKGKKDISVIYIINLERKYYNIL